jgi:hypothetical protein
MNNRGGIIMMMTENKEVVEKEYILTAHDRCDQCSAQALVLVKGVNGELTFCGHHYARNEAALIKFAYEIVDERDKLIENKAIEAPHA